jgi:hypothetical protein
VPKDVNAEDGRGNILRAIRKYLKYQWMEKMMNLLTKAAVSLAATSMIAAPVAASAATAFDGARSTSAVSKKNGLEGGSSWIIAVLAVAAIIGGIIIAADNDSDTPTSPA